MAAVSSQDLITEENVRKTLQADKGRDAHLISWKIVDFTKKGDNYACIVTSVKVKYSARGQNGDVIYIVKLNPCKKAIISEDVIEIFFAKEGKFYLNLMPELSSVLEDHSLELLHFPTCFHGCLDNKTQQIYFSDKRNEGYKMFDKTKGLDKAHTSLVVKELGRLHATSILLEDKLQMAVEEKHEFLSLEFFAINGNADKLERMQKVISKTVGMLKRVGGYERAIAWAEGLKQRLEYLLDEGLKSNRFNVVNHGDCWNNNLLFRYNDDGLPTDVTLLDLQICRKASLAIDLNYLFYTSLDGNVRKNNLRDFLSTYYSSFKGVIEAGGLDIRFTENDLLEEFRAKNDVGAFFAMLVLPFVLQPPEDIPKRGDVSEEEYKKVVEDYLVKSESIVSKDPIFKSRFLSMFDEFMDCGVIP